MLLKTLDEIELSLINLDYNIKMKGSIVKVSIFIISVMISLSACSSKKESLSEYEYQRSNAASEKALDRLDRE